AAGGSAVEVDLDPVAQGGGGLQDGGGGRAAVSVGARDGERAGLGEEGEGDLVVGHAQGDGAAGVPEVPGERGLGAADHGEGAGPEGLDEGVDAVGHVGGEAREGGRRRDEDGWRVLTAAALGG